VSGGATATGKAVDEFLAFAYWREGLPTVIVRYFMAAARDRQATTA
jgi:hypothetical protein